MDMHDQTLSLTPNETTTRTDDGVITSPSVADLSTVDPQALAHEVREDDRPLVSNQLGWDGS